MLTIIESPYAGDVERNVAYARRALLDSIRLGELPFASHLLYTQVLDDNDPDDRVIGINHNLVMIERADLVAVYTDYGISPGMQQAINYAEELGIRIVDRSIGPNP